MKVGCIGLGDIAQKAYLPVLSAQPGHRTAPADPHARHPAPGRRQPAPSPPGQRHTDLDALLAAGPGRGVRPRAHRRPPRDRRPGCSRPACRPTSTSRSPTNSPTPSGWCGSPRSADVSLAVGFNRRYAPGYAQCLEHPRELILMQKNRVGLPEEPRTMVLDDFIHVVDTLRFLVPGPGRPHRRAGPDRGRAAAPRRAPAVRRRLHRPRRDEPAERLDRGDPRGLRAGHQAAGRSTSPRSSTTRGSRPCGGAATGCRWPGSAASSRSCSPSSTPCGRAGCSAPGTRWRPTSCASGSSPRYRRAPGTLNHRDFSAKSPARISGSPKRGAGSATWRRRTRDGVRLAAELRLSAGAP